MLTEVQQLGDDTAKLAASPLWSLTDDDTVACLHAAYRLEQAAVALQAALVQQAADRDLPAQHGNRSTPTWIRSQLQLDLGPARDLAALATTLHTRPGMEEALLDGRTDVRQASVIAATLDTVTTGLPELDDVSPAEARQIIGHAEATLVDWAGRLTARQLRTVGGRILDHVAPHVAERADELALARQEARAHRSRGFTLSAPVDGMVHLSGTLTVEDAALVTAALHPLCTPPTARAAAGTGAGADPGTHTDPGAVPGTSADPGAGAGANADPGSGANPGTFTERGADDGRRPAQRRADALIEVCRLALRTGELPETGGEPAQLTVTVAFDPIAHALGIATTDSGERLSAATARRLACDARILPVVLGGAGQVLDVGRSRRLATGSLRRALGVRDRGCAFPDCDRPPRWTDGHHITGWEAGGTTDLDNLVLLCRSHHRLIHHPIAGWHIRLGADRQPDFIPPATVDPARRPRRNLYHPRPEVSQPRRHPVGSA